MNQNMYNFWLPIKCSLLNLSHNFIHPKPHRPGNKDTRRQKLFHTQSPQSCGMMTSAAGKNHITRLPVVCEEYVLCVEHAVVVWWYTCIEYIFLK